MKLKIFGRLLAIISTIVAIIQIIKWISPHPADPIPIIEICYDRQRIILPYNIKDAIIELNNRMPLNYESRALLEQLRKSITDEKDKYRISFLISIIDKLTSVRVFRYDPYPEVFIFQVKNIGMKTAHNLKILLPVSGYVEVYMRSSPTIRKEVEGAYIFDSLQPNDEASIDYWPSLSILGSEEIKASYENGTAKVIKGCR